MIENFEKNYEVCNCKKVTLEEIISAIKQGAKNLGQIQDMTTAGTDCRHCVFPEGDFGRVKKKIYCKDILQELKEKAVTNG